MSVTAYPRADLTVARIIAQMCCPERSVQEDGASPLKQSLVLGGDDQAIAGLIGACIRNKVPLLSLRAAEAIDADWQARQGQAASILSASASYRQAIEAERADWANTRREYLLVQGSFLGAGIRAVLIKSAGMAPSLPYRSDNLDVLVDPCHDRRARQILVDLGYIEVTNVEEPLKFLFRKFHLGESISAIHLHESVGWGTGFMDDAAVLADARPAPDDPQLLIPVAEDALLITMAHAFYEDKEIKLGDLWKVIHLLRENRLDWDRVERQAAGRGWLDGLHTCVLLWSALEERLYSEHSFPAQAVASARQSVPAYSARYLQERLGERIRFPFRVSFRFSKRLYYGKVLRDPALPRRQKAVDITRHTLAGLKRRLPKTQPAMLITLSGIDGSGKTVHAEPLCQALRQCEIDARVVWMRGGSSPLADRVIGWIKPWLARNSGRGHAAGGPDPSSNTREAKVTRKSAWLRSPLLRAGWISLVTVDLLLTCAKQVSWPLARGQVVICDRYIYDSLVEMAALAHNERVLMGWSARILRTLCPRPRQAYLLDVAPQQAMVRKPDEVTDFLIEQSLLYRKTATSWGLCVVDTNNDQAISTDRLVHKVLLEYYRDWHTVIAGLFWANPLKHDVDS